MDLFWNAMGATASAVAAGLALVALIYSLRTFNQSLRHSHYEILDTMYWDLLKAGLERPHLRNPNASRTPEQEQEYEVYAHMAWCAVETIFDRAAPDIELLDVWRSAIEIENRLHREWFDRPDNQYKFRAAFREYVTKEFPVAASLS